jgi:hypothetical protein
MRGELLRESQKHGAVKQLRQIPSIGPIRAALLQTHTVFAPSPKGLHLASVKGSNGKSSNPGKRSNRDKRGWWHNLGILGFSIKR